ncbi:MAG: DUF2284 domain-containing protein [Promethearchaeota archaeon]|jgi:predicted metal-binding protein
MPFLEIKLNDIIFDPEVQSYCNSPNYKCPSYGHSWACPPEAPYLEEFVSNFKKFFLVYYKININDRIEQEKSNNPQVSEIDITNKSFKDSYIHNNLEKEIFILLEKFAKDYEEKLVLLGGSCNRYC